MGTPTPGRRRRVRGRDHRGRYAHGGRREFDPVASAAGPYKLVVVVVPYESVVEIVGDEALPLAI